jgi:hypothetical protein
VVSGQVDSHCLRRPCCRSCTEKCHLKNWRGHLIATLFGKVMVRLPRFLWPACNRTETGVGRPSRCRSTPELELQALFSALMTYRVAAEVLQHLLPIDAGRSPEKLRHHTLRTGEQIGTTTRNSPTPSMYSCVSGRATNSTLIPSGRLPLAHQPVARSDVPTPVVRLVSCRQIRGERRWPSRRGTGGGSQAPLSAQLPVGRVH